MIALRCQRLTESAHFQRLAIGVIVFAGLLAGLETNAAVVHEAGPLLLWLDRGVLAFFIVELALRLTAHGRQPWRFFRDSWNVFDFVIVALCLLPASGPFAAVLRLARVLRLLRLVSAVPKLQLLTGALLKSLSAMGYVGILLALVAYIYGVLGVHLFGPADARHFGSLGAALLTLFQVITLDNWSDILGGVREHAPLGALLYFVSFILLGTMIMLNLFIGIIMNSMSAMHAEMEEGERARHLRDTGETTLVDELHRLERQIESLKKQTALVLRRASSEGVAPRGVSAREPIKSL